MLELKIGDIVRVKKDVKMTNPLWYHHDHQISAHFTVYKIEGNTIVLTCSKCPNFSTVRISNYKDQYEKTSIIKIKQVNLWEIP